MLYTCCIALDISTKNNQETVKTKLSRDRVKIHRRMTHNIEGPFFLPLFVFEE